MPVLSTRITSINGGGSDGWDVFNRARAMIAAGIDVTELTIGEHDIRTDPAILNAMHASALNGHTGYAAVPGTNALRDAVATRLTRQTGVATNRDNVLITPGGQAALFAAHVAACSAGDTALFVDPFYATYPGSIRAAGAIPQAITTRARDRFLPQRDALALAAIGAASLLINTPNNPTGTVYPRETLDDIATVVRDHDLWLISDEVYDTQVWDGSHISPRALPRMAERTLVIGSMSKSHAMTGSRLGWIVAPEAVITPLIDLATNTTYGVPGYIQDAALFALEQGSTLEEAVAAPFRRRRMLAQQILGAQSVVGQIPSQGAMYVMLDIRATALSGESFANALLDTHHIAVMPGESFGASAAGHVRVALTVADDALAQALGTLCEFAAERATAR
ncbi:pyridoxal phosphate-dependent aminotransferase [Puniceibacterium sp. IMCC21224]|uniref:pyridoxal phosphate-dependent aminotransferase n=1 Tax=Puniceibacterium sp. IMCC21224 TaxID=1618204 RepID=UPI00064D7B2E|nr:pyridoxal phosphate-dependent aminotransferase [Puniceibacterium sp. IMCC21224]KMK67591.1 aspartate/tyrosine/aromatic aminotransferase [Puniceibacterium sp. IMCC21224]